MNYSKQELDFIEYAKSVAAKTPANGTRRYLYIPHRNREIYSESVVPYSMSAVFCAERRYGIGMDLYYVWAFVRLDRWGYVEPYDDYEEAIKIMQMIAEAKKKLAQPEDLSIIEKNMPIIDEFHAHPTIFPLVEIDVSGLLSALKKATNAIKKFRYAAQGKKPRRRRVIKRIK